MISSVLYFVTHGASVVVGLLLIGVGILSGAIVADAIRRFRARRRRVASEWQTIEEVIRERDLNGGEASQLRALIRRWSPREPLRAVSVRRHFDECVEAEVRRLSRPGRERELESAGITLRDIRSRLGLDYVAFGQRIYSTRELYVGQAVWIASPADVTLRWARMGVTAVDETHFHLSPQQPSEGKAPALEPGDKARCRMWREEDARYLFDAEFVRLEEAPPTWTFRHSADLTRVQAREHFRIRCNQMATVAVVSAPTDSDWSDVYERPIVTRIRGRITSLSAGGLALVTQQALPRQVFLRVQLDLPKTPLLNVAARIVESAPLTGGRYLVRAAFIAVENTTQDEIARYVLLRQQQPGAEVETEAAE